MEKFDDLVGQTIVRVVGGVGDDEMIFLLADGVSVVLNHDQDCCEHVVVNDITGDLADLIGTPILHADESSNSDDAPPDAGDSHTWTFYRLSTIKGSVVIRWLGRSNGYYSERVSFSSRASYSVPRGAPGEES